LAASRPLSIMRLAAKASFRWGRVSSNVRRHADTHLAHPDESPWIDTQMKLYGYADTNLPPSEIVPDTLAEVTLVVQPDELRRIARLLEWCAGEMERMGEAYDHVHLADRDRSFGGGPHLVVARDG